MAAQPAGQRPLRCSRRGGAPSGPQPWAVPSGPWFPLHFRLFSGRLVRRLGLSAGQAERSSLVIRPLAVIGNVEAFELGLLRCPEADGQVDELVEDQRAET